MTKPIVLFKTNESKCFSCGGFNFSLRYFNWECRPRIKDLNKGHVVEELLLGINLCEGCYSNCGMYYHLVGWDEWDAIDGLNLL